MMKSESENALTAQVPPYLRAYGSTYGRHRYPGGTPIENSYGDAAKGAVPSASPRGTSKLRRAASVIGVLLLFGVAVCSAHSRWTTGSWQAGPKQHLEYMKEGVNGMFVVTGNSTPQSLVVGATNEYGFADERALDMYGLDVVVEPYRETQLTIIRSATPQSTFHPSTNFRWLLVPAEDDGSPIPDADPIIDAKGGRVATVELVVVGANYALLVQQLHGDAVVAEARATVSCKYVRRELRQLTESDRTEFFEAMRVFYTISVDDGTAKYGKSFSNYERLTAYHNSQTFCYHNGMHFLSAHAAFNLVVERSLQLINPRVSLASWDFMIEASLAGVNWPTSEIFGPDMFGSAFGKAENGYQITDGWFANISAVYDPQGDKFPEWINTNHNAYGYSSASFNYDDQSGVTRTHSYCGMKGETWFAKCDVFIGCYEAKSTLYDWATCMETKVHASMHGMIGGGFNCNMNMETFREEHPEYSRPLLTFALEFLLANQWPGNGLMKDYNTCDDICEIGQPCGCTCNVDPFSMSDDEVYELMSSMMTVMAKRFQGDEFIHADNEATYTYGFMQAGERLPQETTFLLLRSLLLIGCEPGAIGAMAGGASPSDPIFWVLHPMFEKGLHILQLSPQYRDNYDFTWVNGTCYGSGLYDEVPFTEQVLGFGAKEALLQNNELSELLHPLAGNLPYMYDYFQEWGTCTYWDPCPECVGHSVDQEDELKNLVPVQMATKHVDSLRATKNSHA